MAAILVFLSFAYGINLFQRYAPAVLFSHANWTVELTKLQIGQIGSVFFYCYAIMLLCAGILVDRIGSKLSLFCGLALMFLGNLLFATGNVFILLVIGRGLIGIGSALITIPVFQVAREVFPSERYGTMIGVITTGGHIGTVLASLPFAFLISLFYWRDVFLVITAATALTAVALLFMMRGNSQSQIKRDNIKWRDYITLLKNKRLWMLSFWMLAFTGSKLAFQGLWAGVYFSEVYGQTTGPMLLLVISIGSIIGAPFLGKMFDAGKNRRMVLLKFTILILCSWLFLMIYPYRLDQLLSLLFYFLLGVSFTAFSLALMEVKEFCPVKMTGTAVGIISAVGFLGSAVFIQLVGQFLETSSSRSEDIFNSIRSFFMLNVFVMGVVLVGLILYEVVEAWRSAKSDRLKI